MDKFEIHQSPPKIPTVNKTLCVPTSRPRPSFDVLNIDGNTYYCLNDGSNIDERDQC